MSQTWQQAAEAALGLRFVNLTSVSGGDFAAAYCADLSDGSRVFVKTHSNPPANFFTTEATGLNWLRGTKTVNVPEVLAVSDEPPFLVLEWVDIGHENASTDTQLGVALAALHKVPQPLFGRSDKNTTGSLGVPNKPTKRWTEFYSTQRLLPLATIAMERQALAARDCQTLTSIAHALVDKGCVQSDFTREPPSLLHGDLWAGNRVVDTAGQSWLIDPAAHCGHREFDLAMMRLFGGFSERCHSAYHEAYPLQPGHEARVAMHQLAPLVVHAIKFGGSYQSAVRSALEISKTLIA